jgi:predicted nucleic acid-binding protein
LTILFVDTSALAKRYLTEVGSHWVRSWILPAQHNQIITAEIARIEMTSVLTRLVRSGKLQMDLAQRLQRTFLRHYRSQYRIIEVSTRIIHRASTLVERHGLRTLDAIQLASAVTAQIALKQPVVFVTADAILLSAAAVEGFGIENPLSYP